MTKREIYFYKNTTYIGVSVSNYLLFLTNFCVLHASIALYNLQRDLQSVLSPLEMVHLSTKSEVGVICFREEI